MEIRNKNKICELNEDSRQKLKTRTIYINELLCPAYRKLFGECNSLQKKICIISFYTIHGKIKVKYEVKIKIKSNKYCMKNIS